MVCVTAALCKEEGKAAVSVPSKKGRLYLRFLLAAAILAVAMYAYSAFASSPSPVASASPPSAAAVAVLKPQSYPQLSGNRKLDWHANGDNVKEEIA